MYNGQGVEIMYYTNYIIREYFEKNKDVFIPDPFKLGKPEYKKIMDKIYQIADEMDFTFLGN